MISNDSHDGDNDNLEDEDDIHNDDDKGGVDLAAWEGSPGRLPARHTGANTLLHNAQCTQHTAKCTLHTLHRTLHTSYGTLCAANAHQNGVESINFAVWITSYLSTLHITQNLLNVHKVHHTQRTAVETKPG